MVNSPIVALAWVAAAFVGALLLSALVTRLQRWAMRRRKISNLAQVLPEASAQDPLVVYFHRPGCGHCRPLTPLMERLRDERLPVVLIDVQQRPEPAQALGVVGTPTLVRVRAGRIDDVLIGAQAEAKIRRFVEKP